jgi:hypothetical protein
MLDDLTHLLVMGLLNEFRGLYVVFKGLNSIEALRFIIFHGVSRLLLEDMSNHSLITHRVKFVIVTGLNIGKFLVVSGNRVITLQIISEIGHKLLSVIKLNDHGLIVNRGPLAFYEWASVEGRLH